MIASRLETLLPTDRRANRSRRADRAFTLFLALADLACHHLRAGVDALAAADCDPGLVYDAAVLQRGLAWFAELLGDRAGGQRADRDLVKALRKLADPPLCDVCEVSEFPQRVRTRVLARYARQRHLSIAAALVRPALHCLDAYARSSDADASTIVLEAVRSMASLAEGQLFAPSLNLAAIELLVSRTLKCDR